MEFLPTQNGLIRFLCLSEASGYKHIHLVEATPPSYDNVSVPHAQFTVTPITHGKWNVLGSKVHAAMRIAGGKCF